MEPENETQASKFFLLGISEDPNLQPFLFGLFLFMYLVMVLGNLLIILATITDSHLHTPMYLFLSNLSFADVRFTYTRIPKMLVNIHTPSKVIIYEGCITQVFFCIVSGVLDNFLLAVMAYDCFVAICHPLQHMVIMNRRHCGSLVLGCWITTALNSLLQTLMALRLAFCADLEIPHFVCELNQLVLLAGSDTFANGMLMHFGAVPLVSGSLAGILYSYAKIVSAICAISSARGKYKAFSTCVSHLSVVSLFYCTILGVYLCSSITQNSQETVRASVMYITVTPMLNPFIYSLKNKDLVGALRRLFKGKPGEGY